MFLLRVEELYFAYYTLIKLYMYSLISLLKSICNLKFITFPLQLRVYENSTEINYDKLQRIVIRREIH